MCLLYEAYIPEPIALSRVTLRLALLPNNLIDSILLAGVFESAQADIWEY